MFARVPAALMPAIVLAWFLSERAGLMAVQVEAPVPGIGWQALEPQNEGFRIELPGKPEPQSGELDTPAGKIFVRQYLLVDERRARIYNVTANRLPAAPKEADIETVLDKTRDGAVKLAGGKVLDEQRIKHDRHHGRALTVALESGLILHARLFVAEDRLYQVGIVSDAKQPTDEDLRVFSSFKISDGGAVDLTPRIDWRFVTPRGEKFVVEMPDDPSDATGALDTPLGKVKLTRLECITHGRTYFVQYCDLPFAPAGEAATQLDAARDHALRATGGKLVEESPLTSSERPGRATVITAGDRTLKLRTFVDGTRLYQLGTVGLGDAKTEEQRFFESLKLPSREPK